MELNLIYDRTNNDVREVITRHEQIKARGGFHRLTPQEQADYLAFMGKGSNLAEDLNRVENATRFLIDKLNHYGYIASPLPVSKIDWTMMDTPLRSDIDRIRANIDYLYNAFFAIPEWRTIVYNNTLNIDQANIQEWNLQHIELWLNRMIGGMNLYCGDFYAGERF